MRRALLGLLVSVVSVVVLVPSSAFAHSERPAFFPDHYAGSVPTYRTSGGSALVVCKSDSKTRIAAIKDATVRKRNQDLLKSCKYAHIQAAVNAAQNWDRIYLLPGVYREEPTRNAPYPDPNCAGMTVSQDEGISTGGLLGTPAQVPTYEAQRKCPNAQNLIAIVGDGPDADRVCDDKCHIQITGTGASPADVLITSDRAKLNVIRADRADGIYLANFTIEYSDFNNIYALETNGFVFKDIVSRYSREYGFLSFASDNGLYDHVEAFDSGDSGVYPGSGPEGHCAWYGIEIRNSDSHDNTIGYSGTAGNGVWAHDNRFHDNSTGMTTDSFAPGHPGMPQDCAKWEHNQIYSNNADLFNDERDAYCKQPIEDRDPKIVCPTFPVPVGTGALIAGGNGDIVRDNYIYDNWRSGFRLFWVPAALRGDNDPSKTYDTSNGNRFTSNHMGVTPAGGRAPNGADGDFWWDEEGTGNCWQDNVGYQNAPITSMPGYPIAAVTVSLPGCPGGNIFSPGNPAKQASQITCSQWNPTDQTDPPGCDWFDRPAKPE